MIPAVAIADERDPFAIGRRQRVRLRLTGDAPELFVALFIDRASAFRRETSDDDLSIFEVGYPLADPVRRVDPPQIAERGASDANRLAISQYLPLLAGPAFENRVGDFGAAVVRRLLVTNSFRAGVEHDVLAIRRPADRADSLRQAHPNCLFTVDERADDQFARARERDRASIRRRGDVRLRILRCPHRRRRSAGNRRLPQVAGAGEIDARAVGAPEEAAAHAV